MFLHHESSLLVGFGDATHQFIPQHIKEKTKEESIGAFEPFKSLIAEYSLDALVFLHQVHGNHGMIVDSYRQAAALGTFSSEGDFLITDLKSIGLAIATADCLPMVFYDPIHQVIAIAHAGWRGSVKEIGVQMVTKLSERYDTRPQDLKVFFGPVVGSCCYGVGPELCDAVATFSYGAATLKKVAQQFFFNLSLFNQLQLQALGIPSDAFNYAASACTLCNSQFCSHRRHPTIAQRQLSFVALR